jgi:histo-blood group ABO system transferase
MRPEIVEYAKTFDWSVAARKFDTTIRSIISGPVAAIPQPPTKRVAVLTIATGGYFDTFFGDLASSVEARFCRDASVEIFCFTDRDVERRPGVTFVRCTKLGWPFDTLLRFHRFNDIRELLKSFDLIVYMDADMRVERDISSSELWHDFFAVAHPGYLPPRSLRERVLGSNIPSYEIYRGSSAFVQADRASTYVQGCFFGGKRVPFLYMIGKLAAWTSGDLRQGEVPVWHDESFLNRFMNEHPRTVIPYTFAYPEGWALPDPPTILHRQKKHVALRGETQDQIDVAKILEGDREVLNGTYHRLYLRSHEKVQKLEFYVRAMQNLRLALGWQAQRAIQGMVRLARRAKRRLLR